MAENTLSKLLYIDNYEDHERIYLNVNILRDLNNYLKTQLTSIELSSLNNYYLESYLIEKTFDQNIKELYTKSADIIEDILYYMRNNSEFWIVNSQVYLDIRKKTEEKFSPDLLKNLDLIATFNYRNYCNIHCNLKIGVEGKTNNKTDKDNINGHNITNGNSINSLQSLELNGDLKDLYNLMNRDNSLPFSDGENIIIFEMHFIPLIFQFFQLKYEDFFNELNEQYKKYSLILSRIQNFILFFSFVKKTTELLNLINNNYDRSKDILTLANSKKFSLRDSKYKDVKIEDLQIEIYAKIITHREKIEQLKSRSLFKEFFCFIKEKKYSENIFLNENKFLNSETKMKLSQYAHTILYNVILLSNSYINLLLSDKLSLENNINNNINNNNNSISYFNIEDVTKLIDAYKMYKQIYLDEITNDKIDVFIHFYYVAIENSGNFKEYSEYILKYQNFFDSRISKIKEKLQRSKTEKNLVIEQFGNNIDEQYYNNLAIEYNDKYYYHESSKLDRIYKLENLALNWTEKDFKKFYEGLEKYKSHQLANRKIATYMGPHIQSSHVKFYRGRILKQEKDKRKNDKNVKIKEMRKFKRNSQWKINVKKNGNGHEVSESENLGIANVVYNENELINGNPVINGDNVNNEINVNNFNNGNNVSKDIN